MRQRGCSYFCVGLEKQCKVCNFQLKAEIHWSLKWRKRPTSHSSKPVSSPRVCSPGCHSNSHKGSLPQKKDMCKLSLTVFLLHTNVTVEEWKYRLYFFISTSFRCLSSSTICDNCVSRQIWETYRCDRESSRYLLTWWFLERISGWRVTGNWSRIYLLIFWCFASKLLGYSCDWFIQPQKDSPSHNPIYTNKHILLTQQWFQILLSNVVLSSADSCTYIHTNAMITDAMIKTQEDFFNKIFTSHFIARVRKGCVGFYCERELEIEHNCNILTPKLMAVSVVSFSFFSAAQPEALGPLCWVMAFFTASYHHLLWTPTHQGPKPLRPSVALSTTSRLSPTVCNSTGSSNSTELYTRSTPIRSLKSNV